MNDLLLQLFHRVDQRATALHQEFEKELEKLPPLVLADLAALQDEYLQGDFTSEPIARQNRFLSAMRAKIQERVQDAYSPMNEAMDNAAVEVGLATAAIVLLGLGTRQSSLSRLLGGNNPDKIVMELVKVPKDFESGLNDISKELEKKIRVSSIGKNMELAEISKTLEAGLEDISKELSSKIRLGSIVKTSAIESAGTASYSVHYRSVRVGPQWFEFRVGPVVAGDNSNWWKGFNRRLVKQWRGASDIEGMFVHEWMNKLERNAVDRITASLRSALANGSSLQDAVKLLKRVGIKGSQKGLEGFARTCMASMANYARERQSMAVLGADLEGWYYSAILDNRTCLVCGADHNKFFKADEPRPVLPRHWNCRCLYVPVRKGSKQSHDTKETYQGWLERQDPAFVREVLGKTRFELFTAGKLKVDRMVTAGRVKLLSEL